MDQHISEKLINSIVETDNPLRAILNHLGVPWDPLGGSWAPQMGPGGSQNGPPSSPKLSFFHFWTIFVIALKKKCSCSMSVMLLGPILGVQDPPRGSQGSPNGFQIGPKSSPEWWSISTSLFYRFFIDFLMKTWSKNRCFFVDVWMRVNMC